MGNTLTGVLFSLFTTINSLAGFLGYKDQPDSLSDGPYIFHHAGKTEVKWIENNILHTELLNQKSFYPLKEKFSLLFDYKDIVNISLIRPDYRQSFKGVDSIAALSDIHGEYHKYIRLLKSMKIIDSDLNWSFGEGHLVILGDYFDRGPMVNEVLWHLFGLEKQARKAGGRVHILLGNHETMIFNNDIRYIHPKYKHVQEIIGQPYFDLYSDKTVLGIWLRNQPLIVVINDIMFVHAGISIEMVRRKLGVEHINRIHSRMLLKKEAEAETDIADLSFLLTEDGPFWYRGFFSETTFCESKADSIFSFYKINHMVVGHTPCKEIKKLFGDRVFGIDAGLGYDKPGEMLIYKNGIFYEALHDGSLKKL